MQKQENLSLIYLFIELFRMEVYPMRVYRQNSKVKYEIDAKLLKENRPFYKLNWARIQVQFKNDLGISVTVNNLKKLCKQKKQDYIVARNLYKKAKYNNDKPKSTEFFERPICPYDSSEVIVNEILRSHEYRFNNINIGFLKQLNNK